MAWGSSSVFSGGTMAQTVYDTNADSVVDNAEKVDSLDSTAFAILAGQAGGQTLNGGTLTNQSLTLKSNPSENGDIIKHGKIKQRSGSFSVTGDAQKTEMLLRRVTTDATETDLTFDGGIPTAANTYILSDNQTSGIEITVTARRTDVDGESAYYKINACLKRDAGVGTVAFVGSGMKSVIAEVPTTWDCNVYADAVNGGLRVAVTGEAGKNIRWLAEVRALEIRE